MFSKVEVMGYGRHRNVFIAGKLTENIKNNFSVPTS